MKRLIILAVTVSLVAARAEEVFDESFSYDDGPIVVQAADTWKNHSGTGEQAEVSDGKLSLTQAGSEDFHAKLAGGPYKKSSGGTLYASFDVEFRELPRGGGSYFAHFKDKGTGYRGRIIAQATGAEGGALRIGVTSKGKVSGVSGAPQATGWRAGVHRRTFGLFLAALHNQRRGHIRGAEPGRDLECAVPAIILPTEP